MTGVLGLLENCCFSNIFFNPRLVHSPQNNKNSVRHLVDALAQPPAVGNRLTHLMHPHQAFFCQFFKVSSEGNSLTIMYLVSLLCQAVSIANIQPKSFCSQLCQISEWQPEKGSCFQHKLQKYLQQGNHQPVVHCTQKIKAGHGHGHSKKSQRRALENVCTLLKTQQDRSCFEMNRSLWIPQLHDSCRKATIFQGQVGNENHFPSSSY